MMILNKKIHNLNAPLTQGKTMNCFVDAHSQLAIAKPAGPRLADSGLYSSGGRGLSCASVLALLVICLLLPVGPVWAGQTPGSEPVARSPVGNIYIGSDSGTNDSVIRIGPSAENQPGSGMYIGRNPGSGDHVIHVVPPPEKEQQRDVIIGPLLITPEITWPNPKNPRHPGRSLSPGIPVEKTP